jgi:DNA polymerase III sliding clamp (beta) subunit (PCNA family)
MGSQVLDLTGTPNLDVLFSKKHANLYDFPSKALLRAVKRVQVLGDATAVCVVVGTESCEISASTVKAGEASDHFDVETADADTSSFKILAKYLSDACRGAENLRLHADGVPQQILIEHIDCEFSTKHVLGAMR